MARPLVVEVEAVAGVGAVGTDFHQTASMGKPLVWAW